MLILSLDSAGAGCGVCVWRDGTILAEAREQMERGQDQRLMPLVLEIMKKARVTFDDLNRIAVTRGPGSFTGLRIGLAAARGIGFAGDKPVIGIDRFSIFREQMKEPDKNLLVVINSKRKELFCRFYPAQGPAAKATMMTVEEIQDFLKDKPDTIVTGDADIPGIQHPVENETITAAALASRADANDPAFLPRPLYLRPPDVTMKKPAIIVRSALKTHAPLLAEIHASSFGAAAWSLEQIEGSLALDTTQGWVAFEGDKALGFILCQMGPEQTEILTFAVHPSTQRQGIGETLINEAIRAATSTSATTVFLEVAANNRAAIALYEKLGFQKSGIRPDYYRRGETSVDAVFYNKTLSSQRLHKGA